MSGHRRADHRIAGRLVRKAAAFALFGGGGAGLIGGIAALVLAAEAAIAKKVIGEADGEVPDASGTYGAHLPGEPLTFAVLGDSTAAGYGVDTPDETPGGLLAAGLSELSGRPVRLSVVAVVGAETHELGEQVDAVLPLRPDVALVIIGANDVTHTTPPAQSVRPLVAAIERLREVDTEVVVGTCPDLGTIGPLPPPLRQIARVWSRRLAAAQTVAAVRAGARTVSLGPLLGPEFAAAPAELFGPDRFHPSATGYASAAAAMLPSLAAAVHAWPEDEIGDPLGEGEILPIRFAASQAAEHSGATVAPADHGLWARLQRRRVATVDPDDE